MPDGGTIVHYTWNFGDSTPKVTEEDPITTHVYRVAGTYIVTLNVTDSEGEWGTASQPLAVSPVYGPTASFTFSPSEPFVNGTTTFQASSSTPGWNGTAYTPILSYRWNFGDSTPLVTEPDPVTTHVYTAAGNHTVILNVTDTRGWWDTTSKMLRVHEEAEMHDIAILSVTLSPPVVYTGRETVDIIVVVENRGTTPETFNVTTYYKISSTEWNPIGTLKVTQLYPISNQTLGFTLTTSHLTLYQDYQVKAETSEIIGDINSTDNTLIDGILRVKMAGDADGDRDCDADDVFSYVAPAYGTKGPPKKYPADPNFNPNCDFDGDGDVDPDDVFMYLAPNYGKSV